MELSKLKWLGVIGVFFAVMLSPTPMVGGLISLTGWSMLVILQKELAERFKQPSIFTDFVYAVLINVIGLIVGLVFTLWGMKTYLIASYYAHPNAALVWFGLFVIYATMVVSGYFYKRAYDRLAEASGIPYFSLGAVVLWSGYALSVIAVGIPIFIVGWAILLTAYYMLDKTEMNPS